MAHVRALFRVLNVVHDHSGMLIVGVGPTYATRDGDPCEVNKSFWEATPSGSGELKLSRDVSDAVRALFAPGAYLYLDLIDNEADIIGQAAGAIRTDWHLVEVTHRPEDFRVTLSPVVGAYDRGELKRHNGRNTELFGGGYDCGQIHMQINNLDALPFFELVPKKGRASRRIVIDFSPG